MQETHNATSQTQRDVADTDLGDVADTDLGDVGWGVWAKMFSWGVGIRGRQKYQTTSQTQTLATSDGGFGQKCFPGGLRIRGRQKYHTHVY